MIDGKLLKGMMVANGFSVRTFGKEIGVSMSAIYRYMNGTADPPLSFFIKCKKALGLSKELADQIFFPSEMPEKTQVN